MNCVKVSYGERKINVYCMNKAATNKADVTVGTDDEESTSLSFTCSTWFNFKL